MTQHCRGWVVPSVLWVLGVELRSSDLAASSLYPLSHLADPNL